MLKKIQDCISFALLRFVFDPKKLAPLYQPIRFKTETNRDLVARVFLRFKQFAYFYIESSLIPRDIFLAVIGYNDCFGFGFITLNGIKRSIFTSDVKIWLKQKGDTRRAAECATSVLINKGVGSEETVVLRRWESITG